MPTTLTDYKQQQWGKKADRQLCMQKAGDVSRDMKPACNTATKEKQKYKEVLQSKIKIQTLLGVIQGGVLEFLHHM